MIVDLASPVPNTDNIELSHHFHSLSPEGQEDIANEAWVALHLRDSCESFVHPLMSNALEDFKSKVDEIATARIIVSNAHCHLNRTSVTPSSISLTSATRTYHNIIQYD